MSRFEGKGVIVTGAASGISAASVSKFLEEGAYVVIADIDEAAEQQNSTFIQCDVTDHLSVEILINSVNDWLKGQGVQLDVLFNNAVSFLLNQLPILVSKSGNGSLGWI